MEHSFLAHARHLSDRICLFVWLAVDLVAALVEVLGGASCHHDEAFGPRHLHLLVHAWEESIEFYVALLDHKLLFFLSLFFV